MHTDRDTYYTPKPGTRPLAPTATESSNRLADGAITKVSDGTSDFLLSPSPPPLSIADSRLSHLRQVSVRIN